MDGHFLALRPFSSEVVQMFFAPREIFLICIYAVFITMIVRSGNPDCIQDESKNSCFCFFKEVGAF